MIIVGAKGHAVEVLQLFHQKNEITDLYFFDDINKDNGDVLYNKFKIINSIPEAKAELKINNKFVLGVGNPQIRHLMANKFEEIGGHICSIISKDAIIGNYNVCLEDGLNIMTSVFISNNVFVGKGTLINRGVSIHHDVKIGSYCEISPCAQLLGGVTIGDLSFIGAGAIILPKVKIGKGSIIGAGAVVLNDVQENSKIVGVPARNIR